MQTKLSLTAEHRVCCTFTKQRKGTRIGYVGLLGKKKIFLSKDATRRD